MYLLYFYVPESNLEEVKSALFKAGAGKIENYAECCWQTKGEGQFRPLEGSQPKIGSTNQLEMIIEYKVEMVVSEEHLSVVVETLKSSHPYETPAYGIIPIRLK